MPAALWHAAQLAVLWMCLAPLPAAVVPLWHELQLPDTSAWSTRVTGRQLAVPWHAPQPSVERMCVALRPVAFAPSWQLAHAAASPSWLNRAGTQAMLEWQEPHCAAVGMWLACCPAARTPS